MDNPVTRISVRNLVEFILQSGDLDNRRGTIDKDAMLKGSRLHRKLQKQMGGDYRAEVALRMNCSYEDLDIRLEGRADGIFTEDEVVWIDEIKGIYGNVEQMEEPVKVHKAQAMCYGYIYGVQEGLSKIGIQMTYANLETEVVKRFREVISIEELKEWYQKLLDEYHKWLSYQKKWKEERNHSLQSLEFPFFYREGQRKMVSSVYHAIGASRQIFIQAPTGVGKTMSTIFPAVRAVGEGKGETIFYLTAKTITRTVAQEAFEVLREKGMKYKVVTITAKEKLCFMDETKCDPVHCPYARGHFDRVNDAVYELWTTKSRYDRETIREQAEKWQVCPFEMCLDLSLWVDAVICDYNYVFDPTVHLKRFFGEGAGGDYVFLIDEAHNLAERGREMYSASICREDAVRVRKVMKERAPRLYRSLGKLDKQLKELQVDCGNYLVLPGTGSITMTILKVQGEFDAFLEAHKDVELEDEVRKFYFDIRNFLNIAELIDENYVVYAENGEDGLFRLKLFCVNPAVNLGEYLKKGRSAVFFSATLLPMNYYRKLLSNRQDDYGIYVESPFSQKNRCILNAGDVSSLYSRRGYEEYHKMVFRIAYHYICNREEAEDISQVVFGRYYIFSETGRVTNVRSWLATTARNVAVNHVKHISYERLLWAKETMEDYLGYEEDPEEHFFGTLREKDKIECACRILAALKTKKRKWYNLAVYAYCNEMPRQEIADRMGMSLNAVMSTLTRIKDWIRKNYKDEFDHINT